MRKNQKSSSKVRYINPPNRLKQKMGAGGIDEKKIEKSQDYIQNNTEVDFDNIAREILREFSDLVKDTRTDHGKFNDTKEKMIRLIMQLKANGGMFQYPLVSDVADIALNFLEDVETANNDLFDVLRAHETTLNAILAASLKGTGGKQGTALVNELDGACQRYLAKYMVK